MKNRKLEFLRQEITILREWSEEIRIGDTKTVLDKIIRVLETIIEYLDENNKYL